MITRFLIVVNVIVFIWELAVGGPGLLSGGGAHVEQVWEDGALSPASVLIGHQWWRIVTSAFMHASLLHIAMNMFSLYIVGRFIEQITGSLRMLVIYALSLVASGLSVVYFSGSANALLPTLGASGAIFGLLGALFAVGLKLGKPGMELIKANIGILILNLVLTFALPVISKQAHVGGLIAGFIVTLLIYFPPRRVAPDVHDAQTGRGYETEYQAPQP